METTRDDLLWGALSLEQPAEGRGPRVTVDTVRADAVRRGATVRQAVSSSRALANFLLFRIDFIAAIIQQTEQC